MMDRCAECGFEPGDLARRDVPVAVRAFGRRYRAPLTRGLPGEDLDELVRRSPGPDVWSALAYGGHVVDIFGVFDERVRAALDGREPEELVVDWEGKVAAAAPTLDRDRVLADLAEAADTLAMTLAEVDDAEWGLPGYNGKGERVTVADLATIAVHEGSHHLLDVGRVLRTVRGR